MYEHGKPHGDELSCDALSFPVELVGACAVLAMVAAFTTVSEFLLDSASFRLPDRHMAQTARDCRVTTE